MDGEISCFIPFSDIIYGRSISVSNTFIIYFNISQKKTHSRLEFNFVWGSGSVMKFTIDGISRARNL